MADAAPLSAQALTRDNLVFGFSTCVLVVIAHAIAYLTHEYSHSLMAWALGWMADPLALDYGQPTLYNFLFLGDVADNVQYGPIFASNHGTSAAVIALSGIVFGNAMLYFVLYGLLKTKVMAATRIGSSFLYWLALMCAGNVWGYVPIRAITGHADIAIAARGLGVSVWALFPFLIVPALYVVYHFFYKTLPQTVRQIARGSAADLALMVVLTSYWFFAFYGGDGTDGSYGIISQLLAIGSKYFLFPLAVMYLFSRCVGDGWERIRTS